MNTPRQIDLLAFPPRIVIAVKALACQLPRESGLPLSRYSIPELKREASRRGLVASIGETTQWRWLDEDAIRPWCHRSWIFPRDPKFEEKAGRILDLYEGIWEGRPLTNNDFVISMDEKTGIQARRRIHATLPPSLGVPMRVDRSAKRDFWIMDNGSAHRGSRFCSARYRRRMISHRSKSCEIVSFTFGPEY